MILTVGKSRIVGHVDAPSSKSLTHRALVAGIQSRGKTKILRPLECDDTLASIEAAKALGARIIEKKEALAVEQGIGKIKSQATINCLGSATTMRLFLPLCCLSNKEIVLTGNESLLKRPVGELINAVNQLGGKCLSSAGNGLPPVVVRPSGINGGVVSIKGNVSSQFISALLFACPNAENDSTIKISTELESAPYVRLTLQVLDEFGIRVDASDNLQEFHVPGRQEFRAKNFTVEGDFSSAAFLLAAGALAGKVEVPNLRRDSLQADRKIVEILREMGAEIKVGKNSVRVEKSELKGIEIDAKHCPDLVPMLAVLASRAKGKTRIFNAGRLSIKESDRARAISAELNKMNAKIKQGNGELIITGPSEIKGAIINPHNDHRIAMACAVAGLLTEKTVIKDSECISKSFPGFAEALGKLGGDAIETA